MRSARARALTVLLATVLAVSTACSDDEAAANNPVETSTPVAALEQGTEVNGCNPAEFLEFPSLSVVTMTVGSQDSFEFAPACIIVDADAEVRFSGNFSVHHVVGGVIEDSRAKPDPASPIPNVSAGNLAPFRPAEPGVYPFYCDVHWPGGMTGVIIAR
jgi:plastocyanin